MTYKIFFEFRRPGKEKEVKYGLYDSPEMSHFISEEEIPILAVRIGDGAHPWCRWAKNVKNSICGYYTVNGGIDVYLICRDGYIFRPSCI